MLKNVATVHYIQYFISVYSGRFLLVTLLDPLLDKYLLSGYTDTYLQDALLDLLFVLQAYSNNVDIIYAIWIFVCFTLC